MIFNYPDFDTPVDLQFHDWMIRECGAVDPPLVPADGQIQRFKDGKHKGTPAWCVLYPSGVGLYANFADGNREPFTFHPRFTRDFTPEERRSFEDECRQKAEQFKAERNLSREKTAEDCREYFATLPDATDENPYCKRKGIKAPTGCKAENDLLVVPFRNEGGEIVTLQTIRGDGLKSFTKGGQASGVYFQIGEAPSFMCEGIATGQSIHEATGEGVVCCGMASNLPKVASLFPDCVVIADRDKSGTGEKYARESGLPFHVIPEISDECTDANDYARIMGIEALSSWISKECKRPSMFIRGDELLEEPEPEDWLIEDFIPCGQSLSSVIGRSGCGKTAFVLGQVLSIVTGQEDWCGHRVRPGRVAYLNAESPRGFRKRVALWCQEHGGIEENRKKIRKNLLVSQGITKHLNTPGDLEIIQRDIRSADFDPDLIVIDTVNRYMTGNENDTADVSAFIEGCDNLRISFGCAVVFVHHVGWSENAQGRVRGSSVFQASVDFEVLISSKGEAVSVVQTKNKEAERIPEFFMRFHAGVIEGWSNKYGEPVKSAYLVPCDTPEETKGEKQIEDERMIREAFREYGHLDGNEDVVLELENLKKYLVAYFRKLPLQTQTGDKATERQILRRVNAEINPKQRKLLDRIVRYNFASLVYEAGKDPERDPEGGKIRSLVLVPSGEILGMKAYYRSQPDLPETGAGQ